jgi:predicted acylesterase/phospholipase RssA
VRITPPGDDVVPVPPPLDESPPYDRFCDLVTTGGVASGVVYPWAIVEIARAYRFRSIGGTSVGAMAAALAAAAEYGRRMGNDRAFEPLRRLPGALGEELDDGRTRMLSLFQTNPRGRRLIDLLARLARGRVLADGDPDPAFEPSWMLRSGRATKTAVRVGAELMRAYAQPLIIGAGIVAVIGVVLWWLTAEDGASGWLRALVLVAACCLGALVFLLIALWGDVKKGVIDNNLGLCAGGTTEPPGTDGKRPGISEWLHEGIQASAGLEARDRPLTFRDLWCAPAYPGAEGLPCSEEDPPSRRSINLQMITTNVTHSRPYRLPMLDETSRLFYRAGDLVSYFPQPIIDAMSKVSRPYRALSESDAAEDPETKEFLELPGADMPIVVAARLSLSYPLLFSAVPLWAVDYEREEGKRELKRCLFTDGGVSSNFPIHLFDAAMPRWPTFGMWLDRLDPNGPSAVPETPGRGERGRSGDGLRRAPPPVEQSERRDPDVWLPEPIGEGWSDSWKRFDPLAAYGSSGLPPAMPEGLVPNLKFLAGFLDGILGTAIEWRDRTSFRLPHVRNRVARLMLRKGEGGLNIGMKREQILRMAHRYGTKTGRYFVERFADSKGEASQAWQEQRWMRTVLLLRGLRERLTNLRESLEWTAASTVPIDEAIDRAQRSAPLRDKGRSHPLQPSEAVGMRKLLAEIEGLERSLRDLKPDPYKPLPEPELRLRAPL